MSTVAMKSGDTKTMTKRRGITLTLSLKEAGIWEIAQKADLFIGFNILDFDLRFIYQRSVILKIKPSIFLPFSRYRDKPIYDVMWEWCKWGTQGKISLDKLAKALDLPTSKGGDVEGKNVAKAFGEGRIREICKYCEKDVELTRRIYKRMNFEE